MLKSGTIVDTTIIASAALDEERAEGARPEMRGDKKGKDWHFGMKAHIGTDRRGIVHSLSTTAANDERYPRRCPSCCMARGARCSGDQAYWSEAHRPAALAKGIRYRVNRRSPRRPLTTYQSISIVAVPARSIPRRTCFPRGLSALWGFSPVRYRGLAKNTARLYYRIRARESVSDETTIAAAPAVVVRLLVMTRISKSDRRAAQTRCYDLSRAHCYEFSSLIHFIFRSRNCLCRASLVQASVYLRICAIR